jgi:hypothetical protein
MFAIGVTSIALYIQDIPGRCIRHGNLTAAFAENTEKGSKIVWKTKHSFSKKCGVRRKVIKPSELK